MMMLFVAVLAAPLITGQPLMGQGPEETEISMRDVPPYILRAARRAAGRRPLVSVSLDTEDEDEDVYEFVVDRRNGKAMEVDIREDGTLEEIEYEITMREVPKAVREALAQAMPDFEPTFIERSTRPGRGVFYEFEGLAIDESSSLDVEINSRGTQVNVSRDPFGG